MKIVLVVGARPNFMKAAPLLEEVKKVRTLKPVVVHTGQHYDFEMSKVFFEDLGIARTDYNLGVGSGSHAQQVGKAMIRLERVLLKERPQLVVVVGDANSCLTGALTAAKLNIPIAHVEAGLRSFNRKMPEEINRLVADHLSSFLFATEPSAVRNLLGEGIPRKKIFLVGNIMIDTLMKTRSKAQKSKILQRLGLRPNAYALLTLHRPENVDNKTAFQNFVEVLEDLQNEITVVWPLHPRVKKMAVHFLLWRRILTLKNTVVLPPLGYRDAVKLMLQSRFVMTDSGGIQEETTALRVPCLTLRETTERPITCEKGTNEVVGFKNKRKVLRAVRKILQNNWKKGEVPKYWDGKTAKRIVGILRNQFGL